MNLFHRFHSSNRSYKIAFVLLLIAHFALKAWMGASVLELKPTGDENAYVDAAKAMSNIGRDLVRDSVVNSEELRSNVVGNGWFMPGMSAILVPLYAAAPDAGTGTLRIYLGIVSSVLWLLAILAVYRHLGRTYALALMLFPSLVPLWLAFSFTAWGDLYAGLLAAILFAHAFTAIRGIAGNGEFPIAAAIRLGLLAACCLYLRSNALPLALALFFLLAFASFIATNMESRRIWLGSATVIAVFVVSLLPWSIAASRSLHAPIVTTTTVPVSMAVTFGDRNELCFGPCKSGNIWFNAVAYSKSVAMDTGASEIAIQKEMSQYALRNVTAAGYSEGVLGNFQRYAFNPGSFSNFFAKADLRNESDAHAADSRASWLRATTVIPYYVFFGLLLAAWLIVETRSLEGQVASVLLKLFSASLFVQPFVHVSGGRYWTVFAPILAIAGGFVLSKWAGKPDAGIPGAEHAPAPGFTWLQLAGIASAIAVGATLLILGAGYFRP